MWWLVRCLRWRNGLVDRCVLRVFTCHCSLILKLQVSVLLFFSLLAPRATRSFHVFSFFSFHDTLSMRTHSSLPPTFFPPVGPVAAAAAVVICFLCIPTSSILLCFWLYSITIFHPHPTQFEHMLGVCAS